MKPEAMRQAEEGAEVWVEGNRRKAHARVAFL
jgi:hypothetical protein